MDCEGDEVGFLGGVPVPVLGEEAFAGGGGVGGGGRGGGVGGVASEPGEGCAAVAEEAEGDFGADVQGDDVGEGDVGAQSYAWSWCVGVSFGLDGC